MSVEERYFNYTIEEYYDMFHRYYRDVEVWKTHYVHEMDSAQAIVDFMKGAGLTPYTDRMDEITKEQFMKVLLEKVQKHYKERENKKILFEFQRLFFIASKPLELHI